MVAASCAMGFACVRPASGVMIVVHSDFGAGLAQVELELRVGGADGSAFHMTRYPPRPSAADGDDVVGTRAVTAPDSAQGQRLWVRASGVDPMHVTVVSEDALVTFVDGRVLRLDLYLTSRCRGVTCPVGQTCTGAGACVTTERPPSSLRDYGQDAGVRTRDVGPNSDAFFAINPPPMICGPDGGRGPAPTPGGTPACPDDLNREGCPCPFERIGLSSPCWPGLRVNRSRGQCRDGSTICQAVDEFSGRWGPCVGFQTPTPGATVGASACTCFSGGQWQIDNLSPCFVSYSGPTLYALSTVTDSMGRAVCPVVSMTPPPAVPTSPWSTSRLTADCVGEFDLCYAVRAGDPTNPMASDCQLARVCTHASYTTAGMPLALPVLPAWASSDAVCARRFSDSGGYGEMSVRGLSRDCADVDDGAGRPRVLLRVTYCPLRCAMSPTLPECRNCSAGSGGRF